MTENDQQILIEPENTLPEFTFDTLPDVMREAIAGLGWKTPMPVQAKATPYLLDKRDMIVQSRTGSGKTGAFLIPLILRIDPSRRHPQALILVPTRELAGQVFKEFEILSEGMGLRGVLVYGGVGYNTQLQALRDGAQVVIGTPGRVLDHIGRRSLVLDRLTTMIFDEADEMLSMGFYPDMLEIRRYLPRERASWMFSATMPYRVQMLAREFLRDPEFLSLSAGSVSVSTAEHRYYDVPPLEKDLMLMRLIEMENPDSAIVFCNTKQDVEYLATVLLNYGYNADQLSGDLDQKSREAAMARIRNGETRFLVATDVAARGIDISDLSHVIQYDVPKDPDSYIHRAGRTARAGNTGVVITLIANMAEKSDLKKIARRYEVDFVEMPMPTQEEMESRLAERLIVALDDRIRSGFTKLQRERMKRFISLVRTLAESDDEALLLAMLLDDVYYNTYNLGRTAAPKPGSTLQGKQEQRSSKKKGDDSRSKDRPAAQPAPPADRNDRGNDKRDSDKPRSTDADREVGEDMPDVEEMSGAEGMPGTEEMPGTEGEATKKKKKRRRKRNRRRDGEPMSDAERNDQESGADVDDTEDDSNDVDSDVDNDVVDQDVAPITTKADASMKAKEERSEERGDAGRRNDDRRREDRPREDRPREDRRGAEEVRSNDRRKDEPRSDDRRRDEPRKEAPRSDDRRRDEPRKDEPRKEAPRSDDRRRDEPRKDEPRKEAPRSDDRRRDEPRKDEPRKEAPRSDDRRRDEPRKDDRRKDEPRSDDRRRDEPRKDEPRSDDRRRDEPRKDEPRKEAARSDDRRRDEPRKDEPRKEAARSDDRRRDEPRRDDRRKEERPREERRTDDRRGQERKDRPEAQPAAGSVRRMEVGTAGIDVIEVFEPDAPVVVEPTPVVKREEKPAVAKSEPKKSEPRVVTPKAEAPKAEAPKAEARSIEPPAELEFEAPKAKKEIKVVAKPKKASAAKRPPSPKSDAAANEDEPVVEITPKKPAKAKKAPATKASATKAPAAKAPAARKGRSKEE